MTASTPAAGRLAPVLTALQRAFGPGGVLCVATEAVDGPFLAVDPASAARVQLASRTVATVVAIDGWRAVPIHEHRLLVHNLAANSTPGAIILFERNGSEPGIVEDAERCGLLPMPCPDGVDDGCWSAFQRTTRTTIHDLVAEARSHLKRLTPAELAEHWDVDSSLVVLDTRTPTDRERSGVIPGSIHAPRTTIEWLCDPASGYSHPAVQRFDQTLVVVCNEGYSSSLTAQSLQRLGFREATDLVGGFLAWKNAGLPIEHPDHTAL